MKDKLKQALESYNLYLADNILQDLANFILQADVKYHDKLMQKVIKYANNLHGSPMCIVNNMLKVIDFYHGTDDYPKGFERTDGIADIYYTWQDLLKDKPTIVKPYMIKYAGGTYDTLVDYNECPEAYDISNPIHVEYKNYLARTGKLIDCF